MERSGNPRDASDEDGGRPRKKPRSENDPPNFFSFGTPIASPRTLPPDLATTNQQPGGFVFGTPIASPRTFTLELATTTINQPMGGFGFGTPTASPRTFTPGPATANQP